jgi:hypothetical protein
VQCVHGPLRRLLQAPPGPAPSFTELTRLRLYSRLRALCSCDDILVPNLDRHRDAGREVMHCVPVPGAWPTRVSSPARVRTRLAEALEAALRVT